MTSIETPAPDPGTGTATPGRGRWLLAGSLALVCLASAVVAGLAASDLRDQRRLDAARRDAVTAARQEALNITAVDTRGFDEDVKRVLEGATGDFKDDFTRRATTLKQILLDNKVQSQGEVREAAVVRSDLRTATVLVVIDSRVVNTARPQGRVNTYRMRLLVERSGARWLVSQLEFVG